MSRQINPFYTAQSCREIAEILRLCHSCKKNIFIFGARDILKSFLYFIEQIIKGYSVILIHISPDPSGSNLNIAGRRPGVKTPQSPPDSEWGRTSTLYPFLKDHNIKLLLELPTGRPDASRFRKAVLLMKPETGFIL